MQAIKYDVILKVQIEEPIQTASGIILAPSQKFRPIDAPPDSEYGGVVSIGELVDEVSVGDMVMYNRFAAKCLGLGYPEYFKVNINEILGIIGEGMD